ncbi:DUF5654 family protein [Candidatus Nomurabacteria bacterium]|nr:DUF5654 family protein [Candidatus Nomurabacteria bacterium]
MENKVIEKIASVNKDIKKQTSGYILTAFGLVVGLAWNDAIKNLIEFLFPLNQNSILAKFLYAIILTILIILAGKYIFKNSEEK